MSAAGGDSSDIVEMLITVAQTEIDRQLGTSDGQVTRSLGLLAVNVAAIGLALVVSPRWTPWWLIPLTLAVVSSAAFLSSVRGRKHNVGPDVRKFYSKHGATSLAAARRQLLSQLIHAIEENTAILPPKRRGFIVGTIAMLIELAFGGVLLWVLDAGVLR